MLRLVVISLISSMYCVSAFADKDIKCFVEKVILGDDIHQDVPVTILIGAEVKDPTVVNIDGHQVAATLQLGDEFEPQTSLSMLFDDVLTITYDVNTDSLYQMWKSDYRFQCWFE